MSPDWLKETQIKELLRGTQDWKQEKEELGSSHRDMKMGQKLWYPFFGELWIGANLQQCAEPGGHEEATWVPRELLQQMRKIRFVSLCLSKAVDFFHTQFLSCWWPPGEDCSLYQIKKNRLCFMCLSFFLTTRLQWGSSWNWRHSATDPLKLWCYECLCSTVALQESAENCGGVVVLQTSIWEPLCYKLILVQ